MRHTIAALCMTLLVPASFASEQAGIAFVQAPEQGIGTCVHLTAEQAFACAKLECVANGGTAESCRPAKWCFPSGWSADVFLLHNEGVHWHEFTCGWASRDAALEAANVVCDREHRQFIVDCRIVQIYDPGGKPRLD